MHKLSLSAAAPLLLALTVSAQTSTSQPVQKPVTVPPLPSAGGATRPGQLPPPAHPITVPQAHELMQLTGVDQIKPRLVDNVTANIQRFPPFVPEDVKQDVRTSVEKIDVDGPAVASYQKYLSTEDAAKVIEFYKTPAGKNLLTVTPELSSEIQQNALKSGRDAFQGAIQRHQTEIEAAQKTYQAQHPAPALGGPGPGTGSSPGAGSGSGSGAHPVPAPSGGTTTTPKKPQ